MAVRAVQARGGADAAFAVRYWGVRGSIASPGPHTARYGGNTTCVEVACGGGRLLIDCGTGARALGRALSAGRDRHVALLLSHHHWDHIQGLPFFAPLYDPTWTIDVWSAQELGPTEPLLRRVLSPPTFPVTLEAARARLRFHEFKLGDAFEPIPGVVIQTASLLHPGGASGYRITWSGASYAHLVDTEHPAKGAWPEPLVALARRANFVCFDAMFSPERYLEHRGWGHSTFEQGAALAKLAEARQLVLFHHDPDHADVDLDALCARARQAFALTWIAAEGMVLDVIGETVSCPPGVGDTNG